jgi:hypothetical protein
MIIDVIEKSNVKVLSMERNFIDNEVFEDVQTFLIKNQTLTSFNINSKKMIKNKEISRWRRSPWRRINNILMIYSNIIIF